MAETCELLSRRRLDYDSLPDHTYNFTVTATDNGVPALSGSANVRVSVTNVNDEDPVFVQSTVEHVQVSEDAPPNTVIHVLQAYDPDGDGVTYSFAGIERYDSSRHKHRRGRRQFINPLKRSAVIWLHFEVFTAIQV